MQTSKKIRTFAKMNNVIEHIEYLIRRNDCVVLPSWGAFIAHYEPARYDEASSKFYPPSRRISFNADVDHNDGLLASSLSRRLGIPFAKAAKIVGEEVDSMKCQLAADGEISFGSVGRFTIGEESTLVFTPSCSLKEFETRGLSPIEIKPIIVAAKEEIAPRQAKNPTRFRERLGLRLLKTAAAVAVAISVLVSLAIPSANNRNDSLASCGPEFLVSSDKIGNARDAATEANDIIVNAPADTPLPELSSHPGIADTVPAISQDQPADTPKRETAPAESFKPSASHCLVIGSLANMKQARLFISQQNQPGLKIYAAEGKYRVYIAEGSTNQLLDLKSTTEIGSKYPEAWVCRVK